jgi:hypothetical protein
MSLSLPHLSFVSLRLRTTAARHARLPKSPGGLGQSTARMRLSAPLVAQQ